MKKTILLGTAIILVLGIAAGTYWWTSRPQVILLDNGDKLTLLAVDYGKRHTPPKGKTTPAARGAGQRVTAFTTTDNVLCLWLRRDYDSSQYPNYQFYIYDKAGTACAADTGRNGGYGNGQQKKGSELMAVQFGAFPRRQGRLIVRVQSYIQGAGQVLAEEKFTFANPTAGKSFEKWTPDPLPVTKTADGLSVTLTKLVAGADTPYQRNQDNPDDAMNKGVQVVFHVEQGGKPVSTWEPTMAVTTDATGNRMVAGINSNQSQTGDETVTYQYGLWPDEPAWKLGVEFQQKSGFSTNDEWAVKNIPLQPGSQQALNGGGQGFGPGFRAAGSRNTPFAEADLNGHHLRVFPAIQFTNMSPNMQPQGVLSVEVTPAPVEGMQWVNGVLQTGDRTHMTLVSLVDDQGGDLGNWNYGTSTSSSGNTTSATYRYGLRDLAGVTNVTLTITLNKSHFFEFTAKPSSPEKQ